MSDAPPIPGAPSAGSVVDRENPWPGLRTFTERDREFFKGRNDEIEELLALVRNETLSVFFGRSGLGKSSLLQAGLFPRLRTEKHLPVYLQVRYGADAPPPAGYILEKIAAAVRDSHGEAPPPREGDSLWEYFHRRNADDPRNDLFWSERHEVVTPVLVFDQFEEIFTLGRQSPIAAQFLDELEWLVENRAPPRVLEMLERGDENAPRYDFRRQGFKVVLSLREDFLPQLENLRARIRGVGSNRYRLRGMSGTQALAVALEPARELLDENVAREIVRFVGAGSDGANSAELSRIEVEPALLSVVLKQLNERRRAARQPRITTDLLTGEKHRIVRDFYEQGMDGVPMPVRDYLERELLTADGEFRDRVSLKNALSDPCGLTEAVVRQLVDARIIYIEETSGPSWLWFTHDLLCGAVKASRNERRERESLEAARRKSEADRQSALATAQAAQEKLRRTRMRAVVIGGFALLALGIGVLLPLYLKKEKETDRANAALIEANLLRAKADAATEDTKLAMVAVRAEKERADKNLADAKKGLSSYLFVQANEFLGTANYDAARLLLTLNDDETLLGHGEKLLGDSERNLVSSVLEQPPSLRLEGVIKLAAQPRQIEFVPGGRMLIADENGRLRFLEFAGLPEGGDAGALVSPQDELQKLENVTAFDVLWGDTPLIAAGTRDGIGIFDLRSGRRVVAELEPARATAPAKEATTTKQSDGPNRGVEDRSSAKAPDAAADATAAAAPESPYPLRVRFSRDGRQLAAVTSDGVVTVWQLAPGAAWMNGPDEVAKDESIQRFATEQAHLDFKDDPARRAELSWSLDESLMVADARHGVWLMPPRGTWDTVKPIEEFNSAGLRYEISPGAGYHDSDWFVSPRSEKKLVWLRLPANSQPGSSASRWVIAEPLPDTVHAIAAAPGSNIVFAALRNGTIAACRVYPSKDTLRVIQTVAGPRSRQLDLRLRPDGRALAASADDGRIFLYRAEPPENATAAPTDIIRRRLVRGDDGQLTQVLADGSIVRAGKTDAAEALDFKTIAPAGTVLSVHLPAADAAQALGLVSFTEKGADSPSIGVWSFAKKDWVWQAPVWKWGLQGKLEGFERAAVFSPDGTMIAIRSETGEVLLLRAADGESAHATIEVDRIPLAVAWSGDGQRLAVLTEDQDFRVYDLAATADNAHRYEAQIHARSYEVPALALDHSGRALAYGTPDARLVLELFSAAEKRPPLIVPLRAQAESLAFGPDDKSLALVFDERVHLLAARPADADPTELPWASQSRLDGYRLVEDETRATALRQLRVAHWSDDAAAQRVAAVTQRWADWHVKAAAMFRTEKDESPSHDDVRAALDGAAELASDIAPIGEEFAAFVPLAAHLRGVADNALALSENFRADLTAVQRWKFAFDYFNWRDPENPKITAAAEITEPIADKLYQILLERLGQKEEPTAAERALMTRVIILLANDADRNEQVWNKRDLLLAKLFSQPPPRASVVLDGKPIVVDENTVFSPQLWDEIVFQSPDDWLLDKEAAALYGADDYATSTRFYLELERRKPKNLRYPIRRAQNMRFSGKPDDALALFKTIEATARETKDDTSLGEVLVCEAWALKSIDRLDAANDKMSAAVEVLPKSTWVLREASMHFLDAGLPSRVGDWTERLVALDPTPDNRVLHARYLLDAGRSTEGRTLLQVVVSEANDPRISADAADRLRIFDAYSYKDLAATWYLDAYKKTSDHELENRALKWLGVTWRELNRFADAREAFDTLVGNKPSKADTAFAQAEIGLIELFLRHPNDAVASLEESIKTAGTSETWTLAQLGYAAEWAGQTQKALDAFRHAAESDASGYLVTYADALMRLGRLDDARKVIDDALEKSPGVRRWQLARIRIALARGQPADDAQLAAIDDGSRSEVSLQALALRGQAAAAAERHVPNLNDAVTNDYIVAAGLRALAFQQTGDDAQRLAALVHLSNAIQLDYRGVKRLHFEFGLSALANDPLFQLAENALVEEFELGANLIDIARFEARLAPLIAVPEDAQLHRKRAAAAIARGIKSGVLTRKQILDDPELAPLAPEPAETH